MKTNERIILGALLRPSAEAVEGIILDTFEAMEDIDVANTHRKRVLLASGVADTMRAHVDIRLGLREKITQIVKEMEEKKCDLAKQAEVIYSLISCIMDSTVAQGYIVGKYAQNNEQLDPIAEEIKKSNKEHREKNPLAAQLIDQMKKDQFDKAKAHAENEMKEKTDQGILSKIKEKCGL